MRVKHNLKIADVSVWWFITFWAVEGYICPVSKQRVVMIYEFNSIIRDCPFNGDKNVVQTTEKSMYETYVNTRETTRLKNSQQCSATIKQIRGLQYCSGSTAVRRQQGVQGLKPVTRSVALPSGELLQRHVRATVQGQARRPYSPDSIVQTSDISSWPMCRQSFRNSNWTCSLRYTTSIHCF